MKINKKKMVLLLNKNILSYNAKGNLISLRNTGLAPYTRS